MDRCALFCCSRFLGFLITLSLIAPTVAAQPQIDSGHGISRLGLPAEVFEDDFESSSLQFWTRDVGTIEMLDLYSALSRTPTMLPGNRKNAADRALLVHYLGTGKSIDSGHQQQLPFRASFATCGTDTEYPKMYVSLTLADSSAGANPEYPTVGSVFEVEYDPDSGRLQRTNNASILGLCNESYGITVKNDCSQIAVLCATTIEEHVSASYSGEFRDLVAETPTLSVARYTTQTDNVDTVNSIPGLSPSERAARYLYNGEMWLLEWPNHRALSEEPDKYVIHKGYGGHPFGSPSLAYSETDDAYGAAFATALFDENSGGRHRSAALMVIDRQGWKLNPNDRGWAWNCANGHVFQIRAFWNPYQTDERDGEFGALCSSDSNNREARNAGSIGIKYESSTTITSGRTNYLFPSNNSGVSNGGGHVLIPIDESRSIGILTAPVMEPWDDPTFVNYVENAEQEAFERFGAAGATDRGLTGLGACNWWDDGWCLFNFTDYEISGAYTLFNWGWWAKNHSNFVPQDLSRVGIFHTENGRDGGATLEQPDGQMVKWIAEDDDCMFGAPQLVDLQNGRFLLGFGKFQWISDGFHLRRFATRTNGTRSVSTLIPSEYFLMEIDADGNPLTQPTPVPGTGWGGIDTIVSLGEGRAAWAYIPSPVLMPDGSHPDPEQAVWELVVYESPLD